MPDWWPWLAFAVFVTHLPFFAWRWWQTRERRFGFTVLTFSLLVVSYGSKLFAPELRVGDVTLHALFRFVAWPCAVVSIYLLVAHKVRAKRSSPDH